MRVLVVSGRLRTAGGAESHIRWLIPRLRGLHHEVALWCEQEGPAGRPPIAEASEIPVWVEAGLGATAQIASARAWRPDVVYANGLGEPSTEAAIMDLAPSVASMHGYLGTCISGSKTFRLPQVRACTRAFGAPCLAAYLPRRCGGLSPITMVQEFSRQTRRLALLRRYDAVIVHSEHMRREYQRHGISTRVVPLSLRGDPPAPVDAACGDRLLFVGRLELLKGAHLLLAALPVASTMLNRPLSLTVVGDGPQRSSLEKQATASSDSATVRFTGWVEPDRVEGQMREANLLVLPSVWPEPFGLVGLEAGRFGLPTTAFDVGGIPDWLKEGVNGTLCEASPPSATTLATGIVRALAAPERYASLRRGALSMYESFIAMDGARALAEVLESVLR